MYQALYRSFRPETFDAILGQEHIVRILKNQIDTGTTSHAYLFCGTRGTGKTSTARLLAKGMNCLAPEGGRPCGVCEHCISIKNGTFMDVMEIDAASNNGVENIRELRESVKYPPVSGRCKVYIIDEVHMLSTGAFNALLKTLEEPPENVMFILATTEVHKLPATILSRCLRLDFKRVPERQLKQGMRNICQELGITVEESALGLICANADGSVRDGLSLLDQCISGGGKTVTREEVLELIGASGEEVLMELTDHVSGGHVARALVLLNQVLADGKDVRQLMKDWIEHYRSLLMTKYIKNPEEVLNLSTENVERIRRQSEQLSLPVINNSILELSKTLADAKWSTQPRVLLELAIVRLGTGDGAQPVTQRMAVQPVIQPVIQSVEDVPPWEWPADTIPAEAAPEPPAPGKAEEEPLNLELEDLWYSIFEDPAAKKGSFLLLRMGSKLHKVTDHEFYVEASNAVTKGLLKDHESLISQLMSQKTGRTMKMVVEEDSNRNETVNKEKKAEELARSMGETLGFPVEVR